MLNKVLFYSILLIPRTQAKPTSTPHTGYTSENANVEIPHLDPTDDRCKYMYTGF